MVRRSHFRLWAEADSAGRQGQFLLIGIICLLLVGVGRKAFAQQYAFLPVAGSPRIVKSLFQDARGRLWLGGPQPAWFDGARFFLLQEYGFPPAEAFDFSEGTSGAIWIGAETGVYRFSNGRAEQVATGVAVSVIAVATDMALAAIGPFGQGLPGNASLFRIQRTGDRWKTEAVMSLGSSGPITRDSSGMILYPLPGEGWAEVRLDDVVHWRPGVRIPVIRHSIPGFPDNGDLKVMRDRFGCVWAGALGGNEYDCGKGRQFPLFKGADPRPQMHEASDGSMVLWSNSLLAVGLPGSFRFATRANGLPGLANAIQGSDGTVARFHAGTIPVRLSFSRGVLDDPRRGRRTPVVDSPQRGKGLRRARKTDCSSGRRQVAMGNRGEVRRQRNHLRSAGCGGRHSSGKPQQRRSHPVTGERPDTGEDREVPSQRRQHAIGQSRQTARSGWVAPSWDVWHERGRS